MGGGRGPGGRYGGRRTGAGRLSAAERSRRAALADARREAALPPADAPADDVVAVQPPAGTSPALCVPREVCMAMCNWRTSIVPCPPLAAVVAKFASAAPGADLSALNPDIAKCTEEFWNTKSNSLITASFASRETASGMDRKLVQRVERRLAAAAELRERGNSADLQAFIHVKHPTFFCCTEGAYWLLRVMSSVVHIV